MPGPWILPWRDTRPQIAPDAFVAPGASVIGDVVIGSGAGVFFGCVLRGDVWNIRIGQRSNLQDNSVVHVTTGGPGTSIGDEVTVGHGCILHACTIQDRGFVGMGSLLMDDAVVESDAMLAAGSLLTSGRRVCAGQLWAGRPAKYVRELTPEEIVSIGSSAERYAQLAQAYLEALRA